MCPALSDAASMPLPLTRMSRAPISVPTKSTRRLAFSAFDRSWVLTATCRGEERARDRKRGLTKRAGHCKATSPIQCPSGVLLSQKLTLTSSSFCRESLSCCAACVLSTRPCTTRLAPAEPRDLAICRPMPDVEPVTRASLPARSFAAAISARDRGGNRASTGDGDVEGGQAAGGGKMRVHSLQHDSQVGRRQCRQPLTALCKHTCW